ncbi:MAG: hydrogenase [Candidatus Omnitrophica bacterium]|nr:hydrogenase [Candidatus Omnitrophota bacterium]
MEKVISLPWKTPFGELSLRLDPLSLIFLVAIAVLAVSAGIYGVGYMRRYAGRKPLWAHSFFFALLVADLLTIITANNVILFLSAWEVLSISTYFLIIFNDEKPSIRKAGFLYLVMAHCGTFCLFLMFFLLAHTAGSMNFDVIARTPFPPAIAATVFILSLIGFGVKSGFIPLHIWLPEAHPAAPSHISALLSGVTIKTGIYGICRVFWMVGALPDWCAYILMAIGCVSGIFGVLYAIGQHELKKLLAYHSIENIGIIALGLGIGLLGVSHRDPFLAALGFGGALLHVLNHAFFKGLLFFAGGAVIQNTNTGVMDEMGGIAKKMPLVSGLFMVGALSITGMPIFNGFISEFIIFSGLFRGLLTLSLSNAVICALAILALALMGALALACFTKVYGTVFSGSSRADGVEIGGKTSKWMLFPMIFLAALCVWIGLAPKFMANLTFIGGRYLAHGDISLQGLGTIFRSLSMVSGAAILTLAAILALQFLRRFILGSEPMPVRDTWRCAFSQMSPRFQYTSSSFARSIVEVAREALLFRRHGGRVSGELPGRSHLSSSVHDASEEKMFKPLFDRLCGLSRMFDLKRIRYTQMYLVYIFAFLIFLIAWKMR